MPRNKARTLLCAVAAMAASGGAFAAEPACPIVPATHIVLRTTRDALSHTLPITIVALGSSSTEGIGASTPDRAYPARLAVELRQAWPDAAVHVLNKGIGGQMVDSVLGRIDADVLDHKPTLVIWQVGTNEVLLGMDAARFAAQLDEGVRRILASGADLVLMDNQIAPREAPERLAVVDAIIAREAQTRHVPLFSRSALMRAWSTEDPPVTGMIGPDGLHHTDRGYACVAEALGEAIIDAAAKGIPVADLKKK
jgi:lysophospholipase L1-like esterase